MSDLPPARRRVFDVIEAISAGAGEDLVLTADFRRALLDFGSETPDNLTCAEQLEVGTAGKEVGLKLASRDILLGDIAHAAEEAPMPDAVKAACPDMTVTEWRAFSRVTTLLFVLLSRDVENSGP